MRILFHYSFAMDLSLCMIAGLVATIYNIIAFGFPIGSGIKLIKMSR